MMTTKFKILPITPEGQYAKNGAEILENLVKEGWIIKYVTPVDNDIVYTLTLEVDDNPPYR